MMGGCAGMLVDLIFARVSLWVPHTPSQAWDKDKTGMSGMPLTHIGLTTCHPKGGLWGKQVWHRLPRRRCCKQAAVKEARRRIGPCLRCCGRYLDLQFDEIHDVHTFDKTCEKKPWDFVSRAPFAIHSRVHITDV